MIQIRKDILAGIIFIGFAVLFASVSLATLKLGTATRMGPGYFPLVLAGMLGLIGTIILITGIVKNGSVVGAVPWRGLIAIMATPIVFGLTIRGLGLVAGIALTVVVASLASEKLSPLKTLAIAVCITAFCVAVFHYGLGVSIPLFGSWLRF